MESSLPSQKTPVVPNETKVWHAVVAWIAFAAFVFGSCMLPTNTRICVGALILTIACIATLNLMEKMEEKPPTT